MTSLSQGLKGGLAAGAIYAAIIGLLHLTTLLGCSASQIAYIAARVPPSSNTSAAEIFYGTDIIYFPMVYGVLTLIFGVIFGLVFGFVYSRIPGSTSKAKGLIFGIAVFVIMVFVGPSFFEEYTCGSSLLPYLSFALGVPSALVFGYLLGSFYDSFGRLETEETEERKEPEHWSDAFRRGSSQDQSDKKTSE